MQFIKRIRGYFRDEAARQVKLKRLFRPGQVVQHRRSGQRYAVLEVDLGFVWLENESNGAGLYLDLMTPAGTLRSELADDWDTPAAGSAEEAACAM